MEQGGEKTPQTTEEQVDMDSIDENEEFETEIDEERTKKNQKSKEYDEDKHDEDVDSNEDSGLSRKAPDDMEDIAIIAQYELDHDWALRDREEYFEKRFQRQVELLQLEKRVEDINTDNLIENRLQEIAKTRGKRNILGEMTESTYKKLLELGSVPPPVHRKVFRKGWKPRHIMIFNFRVVRILVHAFLWRRQYVYKNKRHVNAIIIDEMVDQPQDEVLEMQKVEKTVTLTPVHDSIQLSQSMQEFLCTTPEYRTENILKKIGYFLRSTKAFVTQFPGDLEVEIAKRIAYEFYDHGRIVALQGKPAHRVYFVLSGKINLTRQFELRNEVVTKFISSLTKGMMSNADDVTNENTRDCCMIVHGRAEVLIIEKADYMYLCERSSKPPVEFLRSLPLLTTYPFDILIQKCAVHLRYFSKDAIVLKSTLENESIFIIKSGKVLIVRRQSVLDSSEDKIRLGNQPIERLGLARMANQSTNVMDWITKKDNPNTKLPSVRQYTSRPSPKKVDEPPATVYLPKIARTSARGVRLFLTRDMTDLSVPSPKKAKHSTPSPKSRRAYVVVDVLKPGRIYGMDDGDDTEDEGGGRSCSLLSDGAEVVVINKRLFYSFMDHDTHMKIGISGCSIQLPSEEYARQSIHTKETWKYFRRSLMEKLVIDKMLNGDK